jgi:hypothetical protein
MKTNAATRSLRSARKTNDKKLKNFSGEQNKQTTETVADNTKAQTEMLKS